MDTSEWRQNIKLIIRKKERVLFDGDVRAFSSFNEKGVFDILYEHSNFISLIRDKCVIHKVDGTSSEIKVEQGIVNAFDNKVTVYLGVLG